MDLLWSLAKLIAILSSFECLQTFEDNKKAYADLCLDFDNGPFCVGYFRPRRPEHVMNKLRENSEHL